MPTPQSSPRALAHATLLAVERGQYGNIAVDTALKRTPLSDPDRHLYTALVYGVLERKTTLEYLLDKFSSRPLE
jgi:16S rRNA (cytosine967-C5)-methyltransferase